GNREGGPARGGARVNREARAVRLHPAAGVLSLAGPGASDDYRGKRPAKTAEPTIVDLSRAPVGAASEFFAGLKFAGREAEIARDILPEIRERLKFLEKVGLGY